MFDTLQTYWPHILAVLSVVLGVPAAIHATMTKEEVRSAGAWVGIILLSPVIGALLYGIAGINRMRRSSLGLQRSLLREHLHGLNRLSDADPADVSTRFGDRFAAMKILGDRVSRHPMTRGNSIDLLPGGDEAYAAMLDAISGARRSILMETYIFDRDRIGLRIADALIAAAGRGVEVRVLIDAVGARYSVPSIVGHFKDGGVKVAVFNGNIIMGLRLPYANLRTHRKVLVVDGTVAFTGGMNIREQFTREFAGDKQSGDSHFQVTGPAVSDIFQVAAEDWQFASGEVLSGKAWLCPAEEVPAGPSGILTRVVPSGPDRSNETNHKVLTGAFSVARQSILIMSPYFLPDRELVSALVTAARRGVAVDIVVPADNNLKIVDRAMTAQFDQVLKNYCRVWRARGNFNHSKLMVIDDEWSFTGSSNIDPRSLRLNFEIDLEVLDATFAQTVRKRIERSRQGASQVTLAELRAMPLPVRLLNRVLWLGSPFL